MLETERFKIFQQKKKDIKKGKSSQNIESLNIEDDQLLERVISIASNFDQAKHFILPEREKVIHE